MGIENSDLRRLQANLMSLITPHGDRKRDARYGIQVIADDSLPLMGIENPYFSERLASSWHFVTVTDTRHDPEWSFSLPFVRLSHGTVGVFCSGAGWSQTSDQFFPCQLSLC